MTDTDRPYLRVEMSLAAVPDYNLDRIHELFSRMRALGFGGSSFGLDSPRPGTKLHNGEVLS